MAKIPWGEFDHKDTGYWLWRFPQYYGGARGSSPPRPEPGTYNVLELGNHQHWRTDHRTSTFRINFNPKDEIRNRRTGEYTERKQSVTFDLTAQDTYWINYEKIQLADVEYYLTDRVNRHHYLEMMPVLHGIKQARLAELENEKAFVRFIQGRLPNQTEPAVWEAIRWWKTKVIEKRPLIREDAKAVRMILQKLKGGQNEEKT